MKMFFSCLQEGNYVIKVDEVVCHIQLFKAILHYLLKHGWHVAQSKMHAVTLKEA